MRLSTRDIAKENEIIQRLIDDGLLQEKERWIAEMILPERLRRLHQVLNQRTRYISVLLEAIDDGHNQAAVLRTADAFGIQDISVVEGDQPFHPNKKITQGAHKWLTIKTYPYLETAIRELKLQGYRICVSYLGGGAVPIGEIDLSEPTVLLFGNEHRGSRKRRSKWRIRNFTYPWRALCKVSTSPWQPPSPCRR